METKNAEIAELEQKADQGDPEAQAQLADIYFMGKGVERNVSKAFRMYSRAADRGHSEAQYFLGMMYRGSKNPDIPQDYKIAVMLFMDAAMQGHAAAQFNLGKMYESGKGVPQNYREAYTWYSLAAIDGREGAVECRDTMEKNLTLADRGIAQNEAMDLWKEIRNRKKQQKKKK